MHDPCYLARVHAIVAPPREVLGKAVSDGQALVEMQPPRTRHILLRSGRRSHVVR